LEVGDTVAAPIVALEVQRAPSLPWEPIDGAAPNNGTYDWAVTGPGTKSGADLLRSARIAIRDVGGQLPSDTTDETFWISPTSVLAANSVRRDAEFTLGAPRPCPTQGPITCEFSLPHDASVRLSIVDLMGREVGVLADGPHRAGQHAARLGLASGPHPLPRVCTSAHADSVGNARRRLTMLR